MNGCSIQYEHSLFQYVPTLRECGLLESTKKVFENGIGCKASGFDIVVLCKTIVVTACVHLVYLQDIDVKLEGRKGFNFFPSTAAGFHQRALGACCPRHFEHNLSTRRRRGRTRLTRQVVLYSWL